MGHGGRVTWLKLRSFVRFPRTEWEAAKIPAKAVGDKGMGMLCPTGWEIFVKGRTQPASTRIYPVSDNYQHFPLIIHFTVLRIEPETSHMLGKVLRSQLTWTIALSLISYMTLGILESLQAPVFPIISWGGVSIFVLWAQLLDTGAYHTLYQPLHGHRFILQEHPRW